MKPKITKEHAENLKWAIDQIAAGNKLECYKPDDLSYKEEVYDTKTIYDLAIYYYEDGDKPDTALWYRLAKPEPSKDLYLIAYKDDPKRIHSVDTEMPLFFLQETQTILHYKLVQD